VGVSTAKVVASHNPLPSLNTLRCHSAGSSFGPNKREWQPRGCAQSNDHQSRRCRQVARWPCGSEHSRSYGVYSVCGVGASGEGAETQDPLDASRYRCVRGDHRSEHRFEAFMWGYYSG
jgi:hypothetical protein